ncbi:MAG: hypothetical protein NVSMB5_19500 [Candidatus Velthaea sp.]
MPEHVRRAVHCCPFATDVKPFAVQSDDHGDERFEGTQILIELSAETERIGEAFESEGGLGGQCGQQNLLATAGASTY